MNQNICNWTGKVDIAEAEGEYMNIIRMCLIEDGLPARGILFINFFASSYFSYFYDTAFL